MASKTLDKDFPNLRKKPSFNELCHALENLTMAPNSWTGGAENINPQDEKIAFQFLNAVVSSDLRWLKDSSEESESRIEEIMNLASKRMAERCGRSAMGEMVRDWVIPASANHPELSFSIREPALTGDNLGLKTWGTAFALCKLLDDLGKNHFRHVFNPPRNNFTTASGSTIVAEPTVHVLELGAGTGLVGIAIAAIWKVDVILTDLPEIQENLLHNITQNLQVIKRMGGTTVGKVLDWKADNDPEFGGERFEVVVAADPLYDDEHPLLVASMIRKYLKEGKSASALVAVPMRDQNTKKLYRQFIDLMREQDLQLQAQGPIEFSDDWSSGGVKVTCWWSVWVWDIPWRY